MKVEKTKIRKIKLIALFTIFIIIANMFSPYGILINEVLAASASSIPEGEPYFILELEKPQDPSTLEVDADGYFTFEDWNDATQLYYTQLYDEDGSVETIEDCTEHGVRVNLYVTGGKGVNTVCMKMKLKNDDIVPAYSTSSGRGTKKKVWMEPASDFSDFVKNMNTNLAPNSPYTYNAAEKTIYITAGSNTHLTTSNSDKIFLLTFEFRLKDGLTLDDLTTDMFEYLEVPNEFNGIEIDYFPDGTHLKWVDTDSHVVYEGFKEPEVLKTVTDISVTGTMTKNKYVKGEDLNFAGLTATLTYDNGETETITDIATELAKTDALIKVDTKAAKETGKVVFTPTDKNSTAETTVNYYTATGLSVSNLSKMTYNHGDTVQYTGATVKVIYTYGDGTTDDSESYTIENAIANGIIREKDGTTTVTKDTTKLTFLYKKDEKITAELPITVIDPITKIEIDTYPTQTYNAGDTISLAGGKLKAITKSGAVLPDKIDMDGGNVTKDKTTARIEDCTTTWDKMEGGVKVGTAGTATVNAVYTDTDGKEWNVPYDITVNDTISSISINTGVDTSVKNKYGTAKGALTLTGATIAVTTRGGGSFNVPITTAMLTGTYNPNTLSAQNIQVTYAGKSTAAGAGLNITLENYIKGVEVTGPANFEVPYNQDPDYSQIKFKIVYADNTKSAEKSKTDAETVSGYIKAPTQIKTAGSHKYAQTNVNFTYNTPEKPGLDIIPVSTKFTITTVDTVKGITVHQSPNKMTYTYGETFNVAGGYLVPTYESGAVGTTASAIAMQGNSNIAITDGTTTFPILKPDASKFTNGKAVITLNVTYTDPTSGKVSTATIDNITVNDVLESLVVTNQKDEFDWGDAIGVGAGTIKAVGKSGAETIINAGAVDFIDTVTNAEIDMEPAENLFNTTTNSLTKSVKLSYTSGNTTITSTPYTITINNPIKKIIIDSTDKPKYEFEQNEDKTGLGGKIIVVRKATNPETSGQKVAIQDSWVSTLTTDTVTGNTPRNATVTYEVDGKSYTTTYPYYVRNEVKGIEFDTVPTDKLQYGKTFTATGTIKLKTSANPDGESTSVPIQTAWVKQANGAAVDTNTLGVQNLVVTYTDSEGNKHTKPYTVEVQDYVKSVKITPATLTGDCGKTFAQIFKDNNAKVTVTMAKDNREYDLVDGDASLTALINALSTGYQDNVTTNQALTAKWEDNITDSFTKGTKFNVNVAVTLGDVITAVEKVEDPNLVQDYDTAFNVGTGKIRVKTVANPAGEVKNINPAWIKEEDGDEYDQKSAPGVRNIKLVYPGFTGQGPTYSITVKTSVKDVTISPDPYTSGVKGMTLDKIFEDANFTYKITYNGTEHTQTGNLDKAWLTSTYDPQSTTQTLNFGITDNYEHSRTKDSTVTGEVTIVLVSDSIDSVVIEANPEETQKYGAEFIVGLGEVKVTNASGTATTEAINKNWIKEMDGSAYNSEIIGTRQLQVVYPGYNKTTMTFQVNVQDYVKEVKVTPTTLTGDCGKTLEEIFNENSAKVNVIMAKDNRPVELTGSELTGIITALKNSGYQNNITTTQSLNATYTDNISDSYTNGETRPVTVNVELADKISKVEITTNPTEIQRYGEPLNLGNGKITVTNIAGGAGTPISINTAWVTEMDGTPYDNTNTTRRQLKVNYPGYIGEITFYVDVRTEVESVTIDPNSVTAFVGNTLDDIFKNNILTYKIKYKGSNDLKSGTLTKDMTSDTLDSSAVGTKTLNFTVPDNYDRSITNGQNAPKQGTLTVTIVADAVASVSVKTVPTEDQQYGEEYKPGTGTIDVTMASGDVLEDVAINPDWIKELDGTDYNPNKLGEREILIKYPGHEGVRVSVNVKNYVTGITATPKDFTGNCGTAFETIVSGIKFKLTYKDGSTKDLPDAEAASLIQTMKASYKPNSIAKETISFSYTDTNTANFITGTAVQGQITVKLKDIVTGIDIKTAPQLNQKYNMGYQAGTGEVTIKTANNPTGTDYAIQSSWMKELSGADYNNKLLGARKLKIVHPDYPYIEIGEVSVNVEDWIQSYEIHEPTNTKYNIGDTVEDRDGYIVPVKASGAKDPKIDLDSPNVTLTYNTSTAGTKLVEIEYNGKKVGSFSITVTDGIEYIKMGTMPKTEYLYGDPLSTKTPDGIQDATIIIKKYSDNAEKVVPLKNCTLSGYNSKDITGKQTIKVVYDGGETSFEVTVKDFVKGIDIKAPTEDTYKVGSTKDDLDLTGGEVWEVMASGKTQNKAPITLDMITDFDSDTVGTVQVEVTYKGQSTSFPITIEDDIKSISIKDGPTKDEYKYGESLNLSGAKLEVEKDSGVTEVDITSDMVSGYNPKKLGEQELTVTYEGKTVGIITVTVKDYIKGINVNLPKKTYTQGEKLNLEGATVRVMTASGKIEEEAPLTLAMIDEKTPFDPEKVGVQTLKINYGQYTETVKVTVNKKEEKEIITLVKGPDKTAYKQGEELDLTGAMLEVKKGGETKYVYVAHDMISGYDTEKVGEQTITITYKGTKMTFKVTVAEREKPAEPEPTPVEPEKPVEQPKPEPPTTPTRPTPPSRPIKKPSVNNVPKEEPPVVTPPTPEPEPAPEPTPPPVEEKPSVVLGVEDEKDDDMVLKAALLAGLSGAAILVLLAATKRNVQVFVEENEEYCFGGATKVSRKNRRIDINKFLDKNTTDNKVKIVLTDKISKALNGYELEIKHRDKTHRIRVNYQNRPFEIILK